LVSQKTAKPSLLGFAVFWQVFSANRHDHGDLQNQLLNQYQRLDKISPKEPATTKELASQNKFASQVRLISNPPHFTILCNMVKRIFNYYFIALSDSLEREDL
jgi:hypothetical protein